MDIFRYSPVHHHTCEKTTSVATSMFFFYSASISSDHRFPQLSHNPSSHAAIGLLYDRNETVYFQPGVSPTLNNFTQCVYTIYATTFRSETCFPVADFFLFSSKHFVSFRISQGIALPCSGALSLHSSAGHPCLLDRKGLLRHVYTSWTRTCFPIIQLHSNHHGDNSLYPVLLMIIRHFV